MADEMATKYTLVISKTYDDVVLEIASELELTVREGDFMSVLERLIERKLDTVQSWQMKCVARPRSVCFRTGEMVEMTIDLVVKYVLGDRAVDPNDVVEAFTTDAGKSRSVSLTIVDATPVFRLVQRFEYHHDFQKRHQQISRRSDRGGSGRSLLLGYRSFNSKFATPKRRQ